MSVNYVKSILAGIAAAPLLLVAFAAPASADADSTTPVPIGEWPSAGADSTRSVQVKGVFHPYDEDRIATTYTPRLVPNGARVAITALSTPGGRTTVRMRVRGLVPNREYGAHVHVDPCGPQPADAGPHYQNVPAPPGVSGDPEYANPRNEIWLDFTTGAYGNGTVRTSVAWRFGERRADSIVIHAHHTSTEPGKAGDAGARLACVNVPF